MSPECIGVCGAACTPKKLPDEAYKILGNLVPYPGLTDEEKIFVVSHPKEALKAYQTVWVAENATEDIFPGSTSDDEGDAFRHFTWACLLYKAIGKELAEKLLDAHEENPRQSTAARAMDLANNRKGLLSAQRLEKDQRLDLAGIEKEAIKNLRDRGLVVLKKRLPIPEKSE
jgi:hypothetical protein